MEQDSNITVVGDLTNERNTFKCKKRTKLKPECAIKSLKKKKAFLHDSYKANTKKMASVHDSYYADIESSQSADKAEDLKENRAAKRQKYEDNSAAIKASI